MMACYPLNIVRNGKPLSNNVPGCRGLPQTSVVSGSPAPMTAHTNSARLNPCHFPFVSFPNKFRCFENEKCKAYTFQQSPLDCVLHSSIDGGMRPTRGHQTGVKKTDWTLSLPQMEICDNLNRRKRCKREAKCSNVNCLRIVLKHTEVDRIRMQTFL